MLMQTLGGQTKSIMVFSKVAYRAAPPPYRELFTQRIAWFSDSRFLCCHLVEIKDVITEGPSGGFL